MNKSLLICCLFCCFSSLVMEAQNPLNYHTLEATTLDNFFKKDWEGIIKIGEQGLKEDIDYYALRYRLGVAYYELKDYKKSIPHFKKAVEYNKEDATSLEYLYYSYLFSDNENEALLIAEKSPTLAEKVGAKKYVPLDFVYLEGGTKATTEPDSMSNMTYASIGLAHRLGYRLDLYHSFSYVSQEYRALDYQQIDYYLKGAYYLGQGFSIIPAFHYAVLDGDQAPITVQRPDEREIRHENIQEKATVFYLGLQKKWHGLVLQPSFSILNLNQDINRQQDIRPNPNTGRMPFLITNPTINTQLDIQQFGLDVAYTLPFLKEKISLSGNITAHKEEETNMLWQAGLGIWLTPKIHFRGNYYQGDAIYTLENNASIYSNSTGLTAERISGLLSFYFNEKVSAFGFYQYETKEETDFTFYYNTFIAGLKIKI